MRITDRILSFALFVSVGASLLVGERTPASAGPGGAGQGRHAIQFAITSDGQYAWVPAPDRKALRKVRLSDGLVVHRVRFQANISAIELSPDESLLAVGFFNGDRVTIFNPNDPSATTDVPTGRSPRLLEFGSEGTDLCVLSSRDQELDIIKVPDFTLAQITPLSSTPSSMAHASDYMAVTLPDTGELLILGDRHSVVTSLWLSPVPDIVVAGGASNNLSVGHAGYRAPKWVPVDPRPGVPGSEAYVEPTNEAPESREMTVSSEVFVTLSREAGVLTFIDAGSLCVIGTTAVDDPTNVVAGCHRNPWAYVLHGKGRKISGIPLDPARPDFGKVVFTTTLDEPCEAISAGPDGLCWALNMTRQRLHGVDPRRPDTVRTVHIRRQVKNDEDDREN